VVGRGREVFVDNQTRALFQLTREAFDTWHCRGLFANQRALNAPWLLPAPTRLDICRIFRREKMN